MVSYNNYWAPSSKIEARHQEFIPRSVDVAIIGGGLAGLLMAKFLIDAGIHNIAVFEESNIGSHASSRSNGFIQFRFSKYFYEIEDTAKAKNYFDFINYNNSSFINFIKELDVYCELDAVGGLELAMTNEEFHKLQLETEFLKGVQVSFNPILLNHNQVSKILPNNNFMGGIYNPLQATFNPQRLLSAIFSSLGNRQHKIYANAQVEKIENDVDNASIIFIKNSGVVRAGKVVYCTNAYTSQIVPDLKELIKPVRGTTIVTDELSSSIIPPYPLTLESGRESIRSHANRILHTSLKQQTKNKPKAHTALLDRQVSAAAFDKLKLELFKKMDKNQIGLDHTWSSVCSETPDGIPFIGEYRTNQFVLAGFNGYGFSHIYGGVNIIKDLIIKGSTQVPGSKLFNLQRLGA